ncbi:hypothetical protein PR202_ga00568 [Eleusine coracana subsp. coracana]|uniref:DUF3615 domain-containing protein n=1 Tax=Eleusine coracana subsp. coracana TaxID=191504 RepID=A0AAV5BGQ5_ELECO|nr:hypothetical protein PR202_ga00568 [Eleusine coracana subsp. coracana]
MRPIDTMDLSEKDFKTMAFVDVCRTLSSRLDQVSSILATQGHLSSSKLNSLTEISKQGMHGTADPREPMIHAIARFAPTAKETPSPYELELSLTKRPACVRATTEASLRLAIAMVRLILSPTSFSIPSGMTLFPPQHKFEVNMICDESLAITECRSLHGLVRFVKALFPALTTYDATRVSYNSAALAACHPNPAALVKLATVILPGEEEKLKSLLEAKRALSADDIQTISKTFSQYDLPSKSEEDYELLVICGVNAEVPTDDDSDYFTDGYPYSHINIWARLKGSQLADETPVLLFIQYSNHSKDQNSSLCLPVSESSKDAGRCFHCERAGAKVIHPSSEIYLGRSTRFEDMARGDHSMCNDELADSGGLKTVFVDTSEDDCIYFDPAWDADFAMCLNKRAKRQDDHGEAIQEKKNLLKSFISPYSVICQNTQKCLRELTDPRNSMFHKEKAQEEFSTLSGGVAFLQFGGAGETAVGEETDSML